MTRVGARVAWSIGARSNTFAFAISDDRFKLQDIAQAIVETEAELIQDFADGYHPQRPITWVEVAHQGLIPAHTGQIEGVRIYDEDGNYVTGKETSASNIEQWRANGTIFDALPHTDPDSTLFGYFDISNQILEFTGVTAQVGIVQYEPDYPTSDSALGSLQVDSQWEGHLANGAIKRCVRLGVPAALVMHYGAMYDTGRQRILQGINAAPEIAAVQTQ